MEIKEFEEIVAETVESLPEEFKQRLDNIEFVVEDCPSEAVFQEGEIGKHSFLLGLYRGVPLKKRGPSYGNVLPDKIIIYKNYLEASCRSDKELRKRIKEVVLHEIGHYFGLSEEELQFLI